MSFANFLTTVLWHEEQSVSNGDIRLHKGKSWLIRLWSFMLVFSVQESIKLCLIHAREAIRGIIWKHFRLGATKSISITRSRPGRMKPLWKQNVFINFDTRQFSNVIAFLQFDTDALCMVTLDSFQTKVPYFTQ